jgi:hypothetical protein
MLDTRCSILDQTQSDRPAGIAVWLRPGMKLAMHSFQSLLIDMGIDLRRRNVSVPEHFLDDAQIGTVPEEVRREAVPQKVRINVLFQSCASSMFFDDLPDTHRCQFSAAL